MTTAVPYFLSHALASRRENTCVFATSRLNLCRREQDAGVVCRLQEMQGSKPATGPSAANKIS